MTRELDFASLILAGFSSFNLCQAWGMWPEVKHCPVLKAKPQLGHMTGTANYWNFTNYTAEQKREKNMFFLNTVMQNELETKRLFSDEQELD